MVEEHYRRVLASAQQLEPLQQRRLIAALTASLRRQDPRHPCSILGLRGTGKEIWEDMDAQEYVDQERSSWDG